MRELKTAHSHHLPAQQHVCNGLIHLPALWTSQCWMGQWDRQLDMIKT